MNEQLQTAYNEWLLKYGFREVPVDELNKDNSYGLVGAMHDFEPTDLLKRIRTGGDSAFMERIHYQLKTPEELTDE